MKDKTIVIIGGSSGFGFEIARQASAEGAKLIITGRDKAKVEAAATRLGNAIKTAAFDGHVEKSLEQFCVNTN